jgi:ABC-type lipoprotein release transport system permease subunit
LLGVTAHVNLARPGGEGIEDYFAWPKSWDGRPGVARWLLRLYITVLLSSGNVRAAWSSRASTRRWRPSATRRSSALFPARRISVPDKDGFRFGIVGKILAEEMGLRVGDYVTLTSPWGN